MASRSKTYIFVQFRASFGRSTEPIKRGANTDATDESAGLINDNGEVIVEMSALPPKWVDVVEDVDEDIRKIKAKIAELEAMHKKHLLPGFADDRFNSELNIERFTEQITNMFRIAQKKIKKIQVESSLATSVQSATFGKNIQMSLAAKLQDVSGVFRKAQSAYLNKLRGRETRSKDFQTNLPSSSSALKNGGLGGVDGDEEEEEDLDAVFTDAQMTTIQNNERVISEREKEINEIVKSINGLAEIFKELQTMVIDQGTVLDRIDYNIENTATYMSEAHVQLEKASQYQEKTKAKLCIIFLALLVFIVLVILFYKVIKGK
ncbi:UNVERIFIED_CONTAM: hypothetical protein HDU68_006491 [Siphonaria sp. JEL0065]|nr:hypothetical protein HDU68_006491 [Siphonaria sp. JEL0065]